MYDLQIGCDWWCLARHCDWCETHLTARQKRCCSRSCTVRCQNRDRAREARRAKARAENVEFWLGPKG